MIERLRVLNVIDSEFAKKLYVGRSRRDWVSVEPLDEELPLERPRVLSESAGLIVDEKVQTKQDVLAALPYSDRDVEVLTSLDTGYLTDTMPVVSIIPSEMRKPKRRTTQSPGTVLSFPETSPEIKEPDRRKVK